MQHATTLNEIAISEVWRHIAEHVQWLLRLDSELQSVTGHPAAGPGVDQARFLRDMLIESLWLSNAPLIDPPLISVIMPSRVGPREALLRQAIDSVQQQSYSTWELIVVDDSAGKVLSEVPYWWPTDQRVRIVASRRSGAAAARNDGLAEAAGAVITYLDDDCRWFPWWLRAVATAFDGDPDLDLVHGPLLIERDGQQPLVHVAVLDPLTAVVRNPADTNVIAHRSRVSQVWDENIDVLADFDLIVQLCGLKSRLLPVPAATYSVRSVDRITDRPPDSRKEALETVRGRARARRPIRLLAHNAVYPLITETYIGDEVAVLAERGFEIAFSRSTVPLVALPTSLDVALYESLAEGLEQHAPDLVLFHWTTTAASHRAIASAAGVPHAVRLHSFDAASYPDIACDPWCIGAFAIPNLTALCKHSRPLTTLVRHPGSASFSQRTRSVISVSAGLAKKDWPTIRAAMRDLPDIDCQVVIGRTPPEDESIAMIELQLLHNAPSNLQLYVDLPYGQVQAMMRRAGACVYLVGPGELVGEPRSVLEAALAATPLVLPDLKHLHSLVDDTAQFYEPGDARSLSAAIARAFTDTHSAGQRLELAAAIAVRHASPPVFDNWARELAECLAWWHDQRDTGRDRRIARWWS